MKRRSVLATVSLALAVLVRTASPAGADVIVTGYVESSILRYADDGTPLQPIVAPGGLTGVLGPAGITCNNATGTASDANTTGWDKTHEVDGVKVTLVHAEHSCGITDDSGIVYGGDACGMVIEFENGFTVYFAGDTDVFGDMALIAELSKFDVAFLPIGGFFTMGPERAAKAAKLLGVTTVVPMHFGTFPILSGTPSALQKLVGTSVKVLDIAPGATV